MGYINPEADLALAVGIPVAVSFVVTVVVTAILIPILKRLKSTQAIYELAPEKHKEKSGTPTMGGLAILCGVAAGCVTTMFTVRFSGNLIFILAITLLFGGLGVLDDLKKITKKQNLGLKARHKLLLQIILGLTCAVYFVMSADMGTYVVIPFVWKAVNIGWLIFPYIIMVIVSMTNAVNLTDGLDGLASGTSFTVAIFFPVFSLLGFNIAFLRNGELELENITRAMTDAMIYPAIAGACIGFLIFNRYPAKVFMGDTGSLALGAGLSVGALFTHMELLLPVVGFIYVIEAMSVVIQVVSFKLRKGKRVFKMAPLHHHYELSGWHEKKVVTVFVTVTIILCVICTSLLLIQGGAVAV
jgi:phospho-N-acetylmuramoyl-pentapeptide-transferase